MYHNQLMKTAEVEEKMIVQFLGSILRDKLEETGYYSTRGTS